MDDINIVDINKWFEEIVFKVNYTDNKSDIIEWIATCMDNFILFYVNSKIRQTEAKNWAKWDYTLTHSYYLHDIMLKKENTTDKYKYVVKATCAKHISDSINQLKILKSHISSLKSENSWYLLMEHHHDECKILKQNQDSDRVRLVRAFEL